MTDLSNQHPPASAATGQRAVTLRKVTVALISLATTIVLTAGKLVIGVISGSLALIADGLQGLVDIVVTGVTLLVVAVSGRSADPAWTCGRDKTEALAALIEATLLAIIAICIWYLALMKLMFGVAEVTVEPWYLGAVLVAVLADYWRHVMIRRAARETGSMALEANAAHFLTDSLASAAVLLGLLAVHFGYPVADTLATLVVAGFLSFTAWRVGARAVDMLLDRTDPALSLRVLDALQAHPQVRDVPVLRLRRLPQHHAVDCRVRAEVSRVPGLAALEAALARDIRAAIGPAEVLVSIDPH